MKLQKIIFCLCIAALILPMAACSRIKGENKEITATREMNAAIADIISLVEKGESKQMLEKYAMPETLERMKSEGNFEKYAEAMAGPVQPIVLDSLRKLQTETPVWNADFTEATFESVDGSRPLIVMKKTSNRWNVIIKRPGE